MSNTSPAAKQAGAILEIDLAALRANYQIIKKQSEPVECAAVLKADAYGLGVAQVAPVLAASGCRTFFVAHLCEGIGLRNVLGAAANIYVLNGPLPKTEDDFLAHDLIPVLNSPGQLEQWTQLAKERTQILPAGLHIDTGMSRLGLTAAEAKLVTNTPSYMDGIELRFVASHLACADDPDNPLNEEQRVAFQDHMAYLNPIRGSLANSSGIFLGSDYHYDLVRPGIALFGGNPTPTEFNPMTEVVHLRGKIIQVREIDTPQSVGYGATYRVAGPRRIATVPVGYADGYLRALSAKGKASIAGVSVPIVGRVSMDLITLDVTDVPEGSAQPGAWADLIGGEGPSLDDIATRAGTIGYEVLTSLGARFHRQYLEAEEGWFHA